MVQMVQLLMKTKLYIVCNCVTEVVYRSHQNDVDELIVMDVVSQAAAVLL